MEKQRLNRSNTEIHIPNPTIRPINHRIFVVTENVPTFKTKGGMIVTGTVLDDRGRKIERKRHYVIAVADDVNNILRESAGDDHTAVKIERGDMVFTLVMPDAIEFKLPQVVDWEADTKWPVYDVIEIHELAGVKKRKDIKDRKIILE